MILIKKYSLEIVMDFIYKKTVTSNQSRGVR